jgi:hypothetical protein
MVDKKVIDGNFNYNFSPILKEKEQLHALCG